MLKGIIADELRNERGLVRALLTLQARWERVNVHHAQRVIVPSRYSAGVAHDVYAIPRERIAVVPEPIDLGEWRRRFDAAPRRVGGAPTVLSVARMYPRKRLEDLLQATVRLRLRIPNVGVRIVGAGPESGRLRTLATRLGLTGVVTFLGEISRSALAVEYGGADCFCLPTVQEGFGLVFAEAMAAGLPIVACRAAAVPEIVMDGRTGLLVSQRDPDELAKAMERLLTNAALRAELGAAGRRRVEELDLDRVAARLVDELPPAAQRTGR
jgi:glycosyltransferase involved in cell wall biosynthesis